MNKILLIDGNSLVYRAFYGSAYGPRGILTNSSGIPVNAISVFNRMISKAILNYKPSHIFVAFDSGKKTKRHDKLDSYKGTRQATPEELIIQFPLVKKMLDKMGIKRYEKFEIEADDIIASLAKKFHRNNEVYILSSDKDLYQLVNKNITIIVPQNGNKEDKIITFQDFYQKMGYHPRQVVDIKSLVGDPSDNLPGVKGIGEKGAIKLLEKFDNLEGIYENLDKHTETNKSKLINSKEIAFLCKELATLYLDIPVPFEIEQIAFTEKPSEDLINFFKELEINSLVKKYESMLTVKKDQQKDLNNSKFNLDKIVL